MVRVVFVRRLDDADELDRHDLRALMQSLEKGVLRVGTDATPDDRGGRLFDRLAVAAHRVAGDVVAAPLDVTADVID